MGRKIKRQHGIAPTAEGLLLHAKCYGNPDFGQYSPPGDDLRIVVESIPAAVRAYLGWIKVWNLGGGNAGDGILVGNDGRQCGRISYNGKVWPPGKWVSGMEPIYHPTREDLDAATAGAREVERRIAAISEVSP